MDTADIADPVKGLDFTGQVPLVEGPDAFDYGRSLEEEDAQYTENEQRG